MEIIDKNDATIERRDSHTFISLLDDKGEFITGMAVWRGLDGSINVHFPSGTLDLDSEYSISYNHHQGDENVDHTAVRLPVKNKRLSDGL